MASWLDQFFTPEPTPPIDVATTGTINDLPIADLSKNPASAVRFTAASAVTLNGLAPLYPGQRLHLMAVGGALTLADNAAGSLAANRIRTGTGASVTIAQNGAAWLVYDVTAQVWRLSNGAGAGSGITPPAGATAGDLLIYSAGAWNRLPIGTTGQLLQVVSGLPAWVSPTFDPSSFNWSGWWRANYAASPWAGASSAGASSGRNLTEATNPATTGTAVNGYVPALFNATTTKMNGGSVTWIGQSSYTMMALVKLTSYASGSQANPFDYPFIVADTPGNWGMYVTTTGVGLYHNDTAAGTKSITAAMSTNAWHLVVATYDGTNITLFIDGTQVAQLAAIDLDPSYPTAPIYAGQNYAGAQHTACQLLELGLSGNAMTASQMSGMKASFNARYGLSL